MSLERKLEGLESELKLVKGEIKQTLIDLREHLAQREAPFANLKVARLSGEAQAAPPAPPRQEESEAGPMTEPAPHHPAHAVSPHAHAAPAQAAAPAPVYAAAAAPPVIAPAYPQPQAAWADAYPPPVAQPAPAYPPPTAQPAPAYPPPVAQPAPAYPPPAAQAAPAYPPPAAQAAPGPEPAPANAPWRGAILTLAPKGRQAANPPAPAPEAAPPPPEPAPPEPAPPEPAPVTPFATARAAAGPDVHTVAGIIKWLAWTKDLIGPEGPDRLLELYNLTFHIPPQTREMIQAAQALVPDPPQPPATASAEDSIALLLELHGILSGGGALMLLLHAMPQRGV